MLTASRLGRLPVLVTTGFLLASCSLAGTEPANPIPTITAFSPAQATRGRGELVLSVLGAGFVNSSELTVDGVQQPVQYISGTQLRVTLPASTFTTARSIPLVVLNPQPGGGVSNTKTFPVVNP